MSNSVLNTYFCNELVKAGFPEDLNVEYSLSYCQGDGVAFYGYLDTKDLINLFNKRNPQKRKQNMFANLVNHIEASKYCNDIEVEICRNNYGYRYSHCNTMNLSAQPSECLVFFEDCDARKEWHFPAGKVGKYKALWDDFIRDLEDYIKDVSCHLEQVGYQIIEASPYDTETVFKFNTENFVVKLQRKHSEFYAEPVEWTFGDMVDLETGIKAIRQGKLCYADFEATVTDKESGIELGGYAITGLSYSPDDRTLSGYRQELICNAIAEARSNAARFAYLHT